MRQSPHHLPIKVIKRNRDATYLPNNPEHILGRGCESVGTTTSPVKRVRVFVFFSRTGTVCTYAIRAVSRTRSERARWYVCTASKSNSLERVCNGSVWWVDGSFGSLEVPLPSFLPLRSVTWHVDEEAVTPAWFSSSS